jgi:hypothetical protein
MIKKSWLSHILVYLLWTVLVALGFWYLLLSREVFLSAATYYAADSVTRGWQIRFYDKIFFLVVGLLVLIFIYVTENYLREGIAKHSVLRRFTKTAGWVLLLIGVTDVLLLVLQGFAGAGWLRWVVIVAELVLGVAFSWVGRRATKPRPDQSSLEDKSLHNE